MKQQSYHSLSSSEVIALFEVDPKKGLSSKEADRRLRHFGANALPEEKALSGWRIFLLQFKSPLIYILVIAGIITFLLKNVIDASIIFGAVFINTILGFFQEYKASRTLEALRKIIKKEAKVLRDDNLKIVDVSKIVPGDIFVLNPGDKVPADGRIIESHHLKIDEMILTGEWLPAAKHHQALLSKTPLADRDNMIYMGTVVAEGNGKAVVVSTSTNTEIGKIAQSLKELKEEPTPYQKKLTHFSKIIGIIIALICVGIFLEGIITKGNYMEMFIISVAVAVAAIPEGLPVAMTVILALGMERILKKKGLIRKVAVAETLGSTSVILTDKTATLTEGKMKVSSIISPQEILNRGKDEATKSLSLKTAFFLSEAFIENPEEPKEKWVIQGKPTDKALFLAGLETNLSQKTLDKEPEIDRLFFDPVYKYSASLRQSSDRENILYVLGAPEVILQMSQFVFLNGKQELDNEALKKIQQSIESSAKKGERVLATAYKKIDKKTADIDERKIIQGGLIFSGLISLSDPLRKDAREAIKICRQAGMKPIIVTGDHKLTALAIAKELNFNIGEENVLTGNELDEISVADLENNLDKIQIFARVEPRHKLKIVEAWQKRGAVVAMTGDGVNDALALKRADIGISLGSGTEVAKEASDLVLLNDNFSIIVAAVEEGRGILDNIRKVITYLLSDSFTEVILVSASILAGSPLPITGVQILWVNLIEDGLPGIALAFEQKEKDIMKFKPYSHKTPLLTKEMKALIFIIGLVTDFILLGLFFWLLKQGYPLNYIRTMIFALLAIDSIFYVFSCKSLRKNLWQINIFDNKFLIGAWVISFVVLLLAIYLPSLNFLLKTVPLSLSSWLIIASLGGLNLFLIEITKYIFIAKGYTEE